MRLALMFSPCLTLNVPSKNNFTTSCLIQPQESQSAAPAAHLFGALAASLPPEPYITFAVSDSRSLPVRCS